MLSRMHVLIISDLLMSISKDTSDRRLAMPSSQSKETFLLFAIPYLPRINCCQKAPLPARISRATCIIRRRNYSACRGGVFCLWLSGHRSCTCLHTSLAIVSFMRGVDLCPKTTWFTACAETPRNKAICFCLMPSVLRSCLTMLDLLLFMLDYIQCKL
jgi:hypothetical protein